MNQLIGNELRDIQQLIHQKIEEERPPGDQTSPIQMRTLTYIFFKDEDVFQRDIEKELCIRRSTATNILKRLERDGYIIRTPIASDARLKKITLTDQTLNLISGMQHRIDKMEKRMRQEITEEDLSVFFDVMNQIRKNLQ